MIYSETKPDIALSNYIDAFWTAQGEGNDLKAENILPDGCVDIIFNIGSDCQTNNGSFTLRNEKAYFVGTMTHFNLTQLQPDTKLLGIRFKPAAFSAFYKFFSLHETTNKTIELEKALSPDLNKTIKYSSTYLNQFFINKLVKPKHNLLPVVADIQNCRGNIKVRTLTQRHFTTVRQLERSFKQHIGISPKEFINLVRYQSAHKLIHENTSSRSLLDIAVECGYYDHAHLTNEIKKYTGIVPSLL